MCQNLSRNADMELSIKMECFVYRTRVIRKYATESHANPMIETDAQHSVDTTENKRIKWNLIIHIL